MSDANSLADLAATQRRVRRAIWNALRRAVGRFRRHPSRPDRIAGKPVARVIGIAELACLENFYPLETDGSLTWRWSGPGGSCTLVAPIDRSSAVEIVLEVQDSTTAINWQNTFLECDGVMSLCRYSFERGRHYLTGSLPARPGPASALMRYHLQECRAPGGADGRPLGYRVGALHVLGG